MKNVFSKVFMDCHLGRTLSPVGGRSVDYLLSAATLALFTLNFDSEDELLAIVVNFRLNNVQQHYCVYNSKRVNYK